jgi:hypothetical protein
MIALPRFSEHAVAYLEDFDRRYAGQNDTPLALRLESRIWMGPDEDEIRYTGPHLQVYGRAGTHGSATITDPVNVPVGNSSFLMSRCDVERIGSASIDLLRVHSASGKAFTYVLTIA